MANEITIINPLWTYPIDYEVPNATGVEKGTLMALFTARACSGAATVAQPIAGISAREKIASDGRTQLALWTGPVIVYGKASGAITVGQPISSASDATYPNTVCRALPAAALSGAATIGYALATVTDGNSFEYYFNPGLGGNVAV